MSIIVVFFILQIFHLFTVFFENSPRISHSKTSIFLSYRIIIRFFEVKHVSVYSTFFNSGSARREGCRFRRPYDGNLRDIKMGKTAAIKEPAEKSRDCIPFIKKKEGRKRRFSHRTEVLAPFSGREKSADCQIFDDIWIAEREISSR